MEKIDMSNILMIEEYILFLGDHYHTPIRYDKNRYVIEKINYKDSKLAKQNDSDGIVKIILIKDKKTNQTLKVIEDDVRFIDQCYYTDEDGDIHSNFIICSWTKLNDSDKYGNVIDQYLDLGDELLLEKSFEIYDFQGRDFHRLNDEAYIISGQFHSYIYNFKTKESSRRFDRIYHDPKLDAITNENVLVQEHLSWIGAEDNLTYTVDPYTFKITSNIKSELQDRLIKVYTQKDKMDYFKKGIMYIGDDLDDFTIINECERYVKQLYNYLDIINKEDVIELNNDYNVELINSLGIKK